MTISSSVPPAAPAGPPPAPVPVALTLEPPRRGKPPRHLADLTLDERVAAVTALGEKGFRAKQVSTHYFEHFSRDASTMTDLPAATRDRLVSALLPELITKARTLTADKGKTVKTLWHLFDGAKVESVLMRYPDRATLCLSSQAGCGMACPFCATGQLGLQRNLSAAEIVEQARDAAYAMASGEVAGGPGRLSNVVFMGMGEPLSNYKAVIASVRRLVEPSPSGLGLSARNITMSTCGVVPGIAKLTEEGLPLTLALSLHAPDDELRDELVPINTRYPVAEVLDAAYHYYRVTGRRISIEYALIRDINDQAWRAELLAKELLKRGRHWVHINPIPLNPTPGTKWTASDPGVEAEFVNRLRARGLPTTIRDTRGSDIDGACGQLAAEEEE